MPLSIDSMLNQNEKKPGFESIEDAAFKRKYEYFKSLLMNNNKALSIINKLEDIILEHHPFDYDEIVSLSESLISTVYDISEDINAISGGKYPELFSATEKIGISILREFVRKKKLDKSNWTIPLAGISSERHEQVGGKAANLGEVFNRVNLPTPRGFAITAFSCYQFLKLTGLEKIITNKIKGIDISDTQELHNLCNDIQARIMEAELPAELERSIMDEVADLEREFGSGIRMAVRSSATGEDSESSFAGQHSTLLNVSGNNILNAYKEVVASTFNPRAVFYHRSKGYRDIDVLMSVLCLMMVESASSGVLYSASPTDEKDSDIHISANWGLGVSVVDGSMPTDFWKVSRNQCKIVCEEIVCKDQMLVMDEDQGITAANVPENLQKKPCLNLVQIQTLVSFGMKLEDYFQWTVDMEWTVDSNGQVYVLQSRPLNRALNDALEPCELTIRDTSGHDVILHGGMTASSGAVSGPAYHVESEHNLGGIPEGAIVIASHTSPLLVSLMSKIAGIVTDVGSVAGHMSSVAREFQIPTLVGTKNATEIIPNYEVITLDASGKKIYKGVIPALLNTTKTPVNLMKDSPVHKLVKKNLKKIVPLNLIDPKKDNFNPKACTTLHDIVRFAHEMAMRDMFNLGENIQIGEYRTVLLESTLPFDIYILDMGGGLDTNKDISQTNVEHVTSTPLNSLLKGMSHRNVRWTGSPAANPDIQLTTPDGSSPKNNLSSSNYAIISGEYMNFSARLGYHFITIDAYCSEFINDNYITFSFKGGAADIGRRTRRAMLVSLILKKVGFRIEQKGDMVRAEIKKYDQQRIMNKIDHIGRLLGSVRLLDMVLTDNEDIDWYADQFLKGNYTFEKL
ncbi:MAG: PEP/pyruvate-binding domain-containing protein [Desulfonatronovibrio sp.]